jgi:hypothetical protein
MQLLCRHCIQLSWKVGQTFLGAANDVLVTLETLNMLRNIVTLCQSLAIEWSNIPAEKTAIAYQSDYPTK